jgi:hypothetical protein
MTERAQKLREVARQALYRTPNDQECEVPIAVAVIREIVNEFQYYQCCRDQDIEDMVVDARVLYDLANELEELK